MGNGPGREKNLALIHRAVGKWYLSSDQGRIPRSSRTDTTATVEIVQREGGQEVAGLLLVSSFCPLRCFS